MAITHSTSVRNALGDTVTGAVDAGTTDAQGDLVFIDSSGPTDLVIFNLQDPAFSAASGGQSSLQGTPLFATAAASGTVDKFEIRNKNNSMVYTGTVTVTGGGGDIEVENTNINAGQSSAINGHTYNASA